MSFKTQVEDLIGTVGDDALISQSLQDIGGEIISALPSAKLLPVAKTTAISSSGLTIADKKVLAVDKSDVRAKPIPAHEKAKYNDTASIYAATDTDPVYYIEDEKVYVNGAAGSGETSGHLHYVPLLPTSDGSTLTVHGDSAVANFPLEAQQLMVLGSAVRCLQRLLANATSSLPSDISGSLSFGSVPSLPSLSDISISFSGTAPVYTAPTVAGETEELTTTLTNDATADNNKVDFSDWFEVVGDFIQTEEDIELAGSQLQKISTYLNAYSQAMQNKLNIFNDANVEYQAELQKAIQNAQLASTDDAQKIQKYQSEIQSYSAQVNKAIQERNSDIQNFSAKLQKQVTDYQWKQSQLQSLKAEYNEGLQLLIGGKRN
jgi:flagellar biosynthesis chaperone FliJ